MVMSDHGPITGVQQVHVAEHLPQYADRLSIGSFSGLYLENQTHGKFVLDGTKLLARRTYDYEDVSEYQVTLKVTDDEGLAAIQSFSIGVKDIIEYVVGTYKGEALQGDIGTDRIIGKNGADTLTGHEARDFFVFESTRQIGKNEKHRDIIKDFDNDRIDLSAIDARASTDIDDRFSLSKQTDFSGKEGQLIVDHERTGKRAITIVSGDIDGDGRADFSLELSGNIGLDKGDFIL